MRALAVLLLVGCSSASLDSSWDRDAGRQGSVQGERPPLVDAGTTKPPDAGPDCPPENPYCDPCAFISFEVETRWPGARAAFNAAAGRWARWYVEGGADCPVRVLSTSEHKIAGAGRRGDILLNVDSELIVDGDDCEGRHVLLVDALTHELGHVYGLEHTDRRGRAMSAHGYCEPVVPTEGEIARAAAME